MNNYKELPTELLNDAQNKWDTFKNAADSTGIPPPQDPAMLASLHRVFAFSDFVSESCIRDPSMLHDLIHSGDLQRTFSADDFVQSLAKKLSGVRQEEELSRRLRQYRRRAMVRIAWRDLAGWADLAQTVADLTSLADACLDHAYGLLYQWQSHRFGIPLAADGSQQNLVVLGLGKLGARELNFSSDVDLMFAFPYYGKTRGAPDSISNEDFFIRLCRQLTRVIGNFTADGFVFRVDLRLRPYGEGGPMAMSFDAMESYYQEQGREWERYALIKARVVAGDKAAGMDLLKRLKPFVYRRYLDYSAFESLRDMKQMISLEIKRKGMHNDIKLGPGGIREIEFFGQIFQLIRGGVTPALQDRRIQLVLKTLAQENFISTDTCRQLEDAYVFLRNTEHRLQEFSDQQTHALPAAQSGKIRLAVAMGWQNPQAYHAELEKHRNRVHAHFQMLLETDETTDQGRGIREQLHAVWQDLIRGSQAKEILSAVGFDDPEAVLSCLDFLRNHLETRELSQTGKQRLDKLIPKILWETGRCDQPVSTLQRIVDLVKSIERRTSYLALLLENPTILAHLVKLSQASPWITTFLSRHPVLLDELLDHRTLYKLPASADLKSDLDRRMQKIPSGDLEYQIEELCIYKQINVLRVAAADVTGSLPLMRVSDHLSEIAETILNQVVSLAWNHLVEKHGLPVGECDRASCKKGFAVIAYGKLGGLELGYGSDLDLVFLHTGTADQTRGGEKPVDGAQFYNRLGQRVIHILTSHTRAGKAYELDMRLRPSGSSGILASHIDGFEEYHLKDSWTWEHQALIKARPVYGGKRLTERFEKIRREVIGRPREKSELLREVVDMRERMRVQLLHPEEGLFDLKQDVAGMVDIEFLVQYLVLLKSHEYPQLLQWTDNVRLLQTLIETGVMNENTAHILKHAYLIYRAAAHQLSLQEKPAKVSLKKFSAIRKRVREICQSFFESV